MSKLLDKTAALSPNPPLDRSARTAGSPRTAPGRMFDYANQINEAKDRADSAEEKLKEALAQVEEAKRSGSALDVPLADLHEVPGRRRHMPPEKYAELRENLRNNKLIHPVVILPRAAGGYEIISGHHRSDAYRELGRKTIRCVLGEATQEEADEGAFFANLMQSDLTDYEKYIGLKRFQSDHPNLTQVSMAAQVGLSAPQISNLLSFDRLPAEARKILQANMSIVGSTAAAELAQIAESGKTTRVVEAIRQIADKKLDQAQAVRFARASDAPKRAAPVAATYKVKSGKSVWCDVRKAKNVMRIEFHSEEVADAVQAAIKRTLEELASKT